MEKKHDRITFGFFRIESRPIEIDVVTVIKLDSLPFMHNRFCRREFPPQSLAMTLRQPPGGNEFVFTSARYHFYLLLLKILYKPNWTNPAFLLFTSLQLLGKSSSIDFFSFSIYTSPPSLSKFALSSFTIARASVSPLKGGSRNTKPYCFESCAHLSSHSNASKQYTLPCLASNRSILSRIEFTADEFCSIKSTWLAPLERASKPSAPLPANKSRQVSPAILSRSQLKRVSRILSAVGRNPSRLGNSSFLLLYSPAMMRTLLFFWVVDCIIVWLSLGY